MNFKINRDELINIFSEFIMILKENTIKPIISGLHIKAKNGIVTFSGTNLEIDYIRELSCEVYSEGEVVFKPNLAFEYIKLLDEDDIVLELSGESLKIGNAEFNVLVGDNFPKNLIKNIENTGISIQASDFIFGLEKVKFSASISNENLQMNCIRVVFSKNEVSYISTDSYRLSYFKLEIENESELEFSIPLESVNVLSKILKDNDDEIVISVLESQLVVMWKNIYFSCKLITLPFPNYKAILQNNSFSKNMEFNLNELKSALKKVLTVARTSNESKNGAILEFIGNKLKISASSGRAKINQKVDTIKEGEDFKCSLNIKFLYEYIENLNNNVIIKGNGSSAMFQITELDDDKYIYILMPLALRE